MTQLTARHALYLAPDPDDIDAFTDYVVYAEGRAAQFAEDNNDPDYPLTDVELMTITSATIQFASDEGAVPMDVTRLQTVIVYNPSEMRSIYLVQLRVFMPNTRPGGGSLTPTDWYWLAGEHGGDLRSAVTLTEALARAATDAGVKP